MPEPLKNCEYFLVEYAPSALRDTRIAIGLFLFEATGRLVQHGFASDWRHLRCLDRQADLALLANLPAHFEDIRERAAALSRDQKLAPGGRAISATAHLYAQLLRLRDDFSGAIRISEPKGVQTANLEEEFDRLFQEHIERPRAPREKRREREGSRQWIRARMSEAIERHALVDRLSRDVPVNEFTAAGDTFRIDFAYRPNGITKYLHAISLERDWNQSKVLGYTFMRIREKTAARMTAVVADADPDLVAVQSCRHILAGAQITLQPLSQLDPFLEEVSRELGGAGANG